MRRRKPLLLLILLPLLLSFPAGCDWFDDDHGDGKAPYAIVAMDNGTTGYEPHLFDGTSISLIKDVSPGEDSSYPYGFTEAGGKVYFVADDGTHGYELWVTDRTAAGTRLVKDIHPEGGSYPNNLCAVSGRLFFTAYDGVHGYELWVTDGTGDGTVLVADIDPGEAASSSPEWLTAFDGKAWFSADDGTHGRELWVSDGTATGTRMARDIRDSSSGSDPRSFAVLGGRLYFTANDGVHGYELWATDGTGDGTVLVADINPNELSGSGPEWLTPFGGRLYFAAHDGVHGNELWTSDGTGAGTAMVADLNPSGNSNPGDFAASGGKLFFRATDGGAVPSAPGPRAPSGSGVELWVTDGTGAGTRPVRDIRPFGDSYPEDLSDHGGTLYFSANDGSHGRELWRSDGTAAGTALVKDIGGGDSYPIPLQALASGAFGREPEAYLSGDFDRLLFAARNDDVGWELWSTDGTDAGTELVEDFWAGDGDGFGLRR